MDYLPHVLAIFFAVGAVMSSERIDAPPRGEIVALRALADGTALVAWRGHAADFITHVRRDGTLLSAEISRERVELEPFASLDVLPEECSGHPCGTYHGKRVVELMSSISIGGVEYKLPLTDWPSVVLPGRLRMLQGELPQLIGLDTADGPIVLDLETHAIVWREDSDDRFLRDGSDLYLVSDDRVRVFDPLTFSMRLVATNVGPDQIGGGFVWTYDHGEHAIDAPVVHAIRPGGRKTVTASR